MTRHARKGQPHPLDPSRPRQHKLFQAAKRSRNRRCHARYERIFRPDILWRAWRAVRAHGGSAGVDGVWIEDVEHQGVAAFLQVLAQDLRGGNYRPPSVRRVSMPKPDGRPRPRGISTVRARVVQEAGTIVIEPLFAAHCQDTSYGFRLKRRAPQAVQGVKEQRVSNG